MLRMRWLLVSGVVWAGLFAAESLGAEAEWYVKKSTWTETMLATRARCSSEGEKSTATMSPWSITGPVKAASANDVLYPEKGVVLDAKGPEGRPLWQKRAEWTDGRNYPLPTSGGSESTYLFRTVTVAQPVNLPVDLSGDDDLLVWVNGQKVHSQGVGSGKTQLPLKAGENQLLMKIHNRQGDHSFQFAAAPAQAATAVWERVKADFPLESGWFERHVGRNPALWLMERGANKAGSAEMEQALIDRAIRDAGAEGESLRGELDLLVRGRVAAEDPRWLALFEKACRFRYLSAELKRANLPALRRAVEDLCATQRDRYSRGPQFLQRLDECEKQCAEIETAMVQNKGLAVASRIPGLVKQIDALRREALLANPLVDFERLLVVRRKANQLGLPQNWQGNTSVPSRGYDNEIAVLSPVRPDGRLSTLYRPEKGEFVGDVDLHFGAQRMLFSMPGPKGNWQIFEAGADGKGLRQVSRDEPLDVDNYDGCYLPDGRIVFCSTRCFHGVPCVGGGDKVGNLCIMDGHGENVRQLCFDQDHNWCPTVLNNGRVLYSRWEYSDSPHYFTRLLFHMNPDGTNQVEYYASNSMWPNSIFYARPIPNHPTKVVAVISGHHGVPRMGELLLFDPAAGRHEASGAVQRIPGYGRKVQPVIQDGLVENSWPKFLHPYPLSDKYFLVSCKPTPQAEWGLYLVDAFDNMLLLLEQPGYAIFEPVPLRTTPTPPSIPDQIDPQRRDALIYLADVYRGKGLEDVPRGTVKKLRVFSPHYAYPGMGGHINIGIDGPWDAKHILGTVPVEPDGSAYFRVPANTPITVQPLDAEGKALQVMRSWYTAMPGEVGTCVGCHEPQNTSPPLTPPVALRRRPSEIEPWFGPARGFSFKREVQPVLDKYCVGCHDGQEPKRPDLRVNGTARFGNFTPSYVALHPYVRRPGPESDYFLQKPLEWHASTSELVQMLEKGHHNVKLDAESWDRLVTWIDINVPDHGTWHEHRGGHSSQEKRRLEMRTKYANRPEDPEAIPGVDETKPAAKPAPVAFVQPAPMPQRDVRPPSVPGWPFDVAEAKRRVQTLGKPAELRLELAPGVALEMVLIPAGEFVLGDPAGGIDESPVTPVKIAKPFYLGKFEVTNAQYALSDPAHDSAYISMTNKDQSERGYPINQATQPVVRIHWRQAMAFCQWLSATAGRKFTLPTEAQWEWACRAGTATPLFFGPTTSDFGPFANLADSSLVNFARADSPKWHPRIDQIKDGAMVTNHVGRYQPNPWGLYDMHGNVAEWTATAYRPYPYDSRDGRDDPGAAGTKVVRGGSWFDRPQRATSSFRSHYQPWQKVYNVGFRVAMDAE